MSEQLHFNILSFDWPSKAPIFYFTLQDAEGLHRVHRSKFSKQLLEALPILEDTDIEYVYTSFDKPIENAVALELEMYDEELKIYKQALRHRIKAYFKEKGLVVLRNFVQDIEVWLPEKENNNPHYRRYYKFSLKIQFATVSKNPELVVAYDGISKVMKMSIADIEDTTLIKKTIYNQGAFNYQKMQHPDKEDFFNEIDFEEAFPLLNRDLARAYNIEVPLPDRDNRYKKYLEMINAFAKGYLLTEEFKNIIPIYGNTFIKVPKNRVNHIDAIKGTLEYGFKKTGRIPKMELGKFKPYRRPKHPNIKFFFIHHKNHQPEIRTLYEFLTEGTGEGTYFKGLEKYINVKASLAPNHFIEFEDESDPLPKIEERLAELDFDHENVKYAAFYISPFDKFTPNPEDRLVYARVKELMLKEGIVTQAIDYQKMKKDIKKPKNFQYTLNNIALAIHAKLGGVPWKLAETEKKELVIGVGAYTYQDENKRYIASAFSFQNNGIFRDFEYFSENNSDDLAGSITKKIRKFTSQYEADKVVIHFFKDMSRKEIAPIKEGMRKLDLNVPLYILNINKTDAQDLIAYDLGWHNLMPKSGTFIRIGYNKFLLFNNARYNNDNKYPIAEGFPFPIKIGITSPDEDAFEDLEIIEELLTQVYQFSRLYWESLRQQNVPVTIKYPEMVAQLAPKFKAPIPKDAKDKLWFL